MSKTVFNSIPKVTLADGKGPLLVEGDGIEVEFRDGQVSVRSGTVNLFDTTKLVSGASPPALEVGATMPDGTVYAGTSPDTGKPMYATPKDAPLTCTFGEAANHAAKLDAHGRRDWRVPTKAELNVMFQNRAAIGNFDTSGSDHVGWYWSSSRDYFNDYAWAQHFVDGRQYDIHRVLHSALRCVRG
jgi:hypothetical protein